MKAFQRRRYPQLEPIKIKVPKLSEEQIIVLSALFVLNATQGFSEAERWLLDFEMENLLEPGALRGFLDFFDAESYSH